MRASFQRYRVPLLLIGAAIIRVIVLLAFPGVFAFEQTGAIHGSGAFDMYAVNLLQTGVYGLTPGVPDAILPPGYSYFLAGVYALLGRSALSVGTVHIALDVLSITLLVEIGRRLFRQTWIGWIAGGLYAVYPYLIFQNLTLIDTPFFMALLYAFLLAVIALRDRDHLDRVGWLLALGGGAILGVLALARPNVLPLTALIALWFLFRRSLLNSILRLIPVALVSLLVVLPWFIRNAHVYGSFGTFSVNGGSNFYQGNNPQSIPFYRAGYDTQWVTPPAEEIPETPAGDRRWYALTWDYLKAHPGVVPELLWVKFLTHWSIDIFPRLNPVAGVVPSLDAQGNVIPDANAQITGDDPVTQYQQPLFDQIGRVLHRVYFGGLLLLSLIGIVLTFKQWREVSLLWFVQICMTLIYLIFHPSTRYRAPTDPLLFLFAAAVIYLGIMWLQQRLSRAVRNH
jgi:4-amino-4-deoxy-L-arabinose transferase-like glycosyltransferase